MKGIECARPGGTAGGSGTCHFDSKATHTLPVIGRRRLSPGLFLTLRAPPDPLCEPRELPHLLLDVQFQLHWGSPKSLLFFRVSLEFAVLPE